MNYCTTVRCGTYHIGIASDTTNAVYNIVEPIFDGGKLSVHVTGFNGGARTQDPNNIHFTIGGVSFAGNSRPDLVNMVIE